jgi:hypothetical protein
VIHLNPQCLNLNPQCLNPFCLLRNSNSCPRSNNDKKVNPKRYKGLNIALLMARFFIPLRVVNTDDWRLFISALTNNTTHNRVDNISDKAIKNFLVDIYQAVYRKHLQMIRRAQKMYESTPFIILIADLVTAKVSYIHMNIEISSEAH